MADPSGFDPVTGKSPVHYAGYVHIANDTSALVEKKLEQRLKEEKLKVLIEQGSKAIPIDEITLPIEEYDVYLKAVFDQTEEGIQLANQINTKETTDTDNENKTTDSDTTEVIEKEDPKISRDQMIDIIKKAYRFLMMN